MIYGRRVENGLPSAVRKRTGQFAGRAPMPAEYDDTVETEEYRTQRDAKMSVGEKYFQTYEPADVRSFSATQTDWESNEWSGFNAAFWNCNGLDGDGGLAKLTLAMRWMQRTDKDYLALIDVRLGPDKVSFFKKKIKQFFGIGTVVMTSNVRPPATTGKQQVQPRGIRAGGILVIIRPRWGLAVVHTSTDRLGLGVVHSTTVKYPSGSLRVIANLWPTANAKEDNGLYHRCNRILEKQEEHMKPTEYIKDATMKLVDQQMLKGARHHSIIGGGSQ